MCGAECLMDNRLIITKLNVCMQPPCWPQGKRVPKRFNISKLQSPPIIQSLYEDLKQKLSELKMSETDVESNWTAQKDLLYTTALHHLGHNMCKLQDWFNENSWMINTGLIEPIKMIPHPSLRKMCTVLSIARLSFTWGSYRMSGSAKRQIRSSLMLTAITGSSSVVHWSLFMVPSVLNHSQCWVLMALLCWHTKTKSLADGQSTSTMCSTALPPLVKRP